MRSESTCWLCPSALGAAGRWSGTRGEDALREMLARHASGARAGRVELPVSGDPDVAPLVDIPDADALAAALGDDVA